MEGVIIVGDETRPAEPRQHAFEPLNWEYDIPILSNVYIIWDFARAVLISLAIMYGLVLTMSWLATNDPIFLPWELLVVVLGVLAALFALAGLVYGNSFRARFTLDARGARFESGLRERQMHRIGSIIGALALLRGQLSPAGGALIAHSQEAESISWGEVQGVSVDGRRFVVSLRDSWHTVIRLYCSADIFDEVVSRVRTCVEQAAARRARKSARHRLGS